jgi:hypothetical protein
MMTKPSISDCQKVEVSLTGDLLITVGQKGKTNPTQTHLHPHIYGMM